MDLEKKIASLEAEIENIQALYAAEIEEAMKNDFSLKINTVKQERLFRKIADKYSSSLVEKEDELELLKNKKSNGI